MSEVRPNIDEIDRKIISCLFEDARRNFSDIGKEIGLSKNAIWTRYETLCKQGIITGATININYKKMGYDAVAQLLLVVDPQQVEQVETYIKEKVPDVFGPTFSITSRYNVRAIVTLKKIDELGNLKEDLRRKLPVVELQSMIWTDVWFLPQNFTLLCIQPDKRSNNGSIDEVFDADKIDLQIIKELTGDSRISFRNIANKIGLATDTVARRYQKLREQYVIVPRIQIDPRMIGYSCVAHYFLKIDQGKDMGDIIERLISFPDLFYLMKCTGDYQISAMLVVADLQRVIETGMNINKIEGLKLLETSINPIATKFPIARTYTST
jgi:DNA-binding Lrp family transcriptional regulator